MAGEPDTFWCHECKDYTVVCDSARWPGDPGPPLFWCDDCGQDYQCDECGAPIERDGSCTGAERGCQQATAPAS